MGRVGRTRREKERVGKVVEVGDAREREVRR